MSYDKERCLVRNGEGWVLGSIKKYLSRLVNRKEGSLRLSSEAYGADELASSLSLSKKEKVALR